MTNSFFKSTSASVLGAVICYLVGFSSSEGLDYYKKRLNADANPEVSVGMEFEGEYEFEGDTHVEPIKVKEVDIDGFSGIIESNYNGERIDYLYHAEFFRGGKYIQVNYHPEKVNDATDFGVAIFEIKNGIKKPIKGKAISLDDERNGFEVRDYTLTLTKE